MLFNYIKIFFFPFYYAAAAVGAAGAAHFFLSQLRLCTSRLYSMATHSYKTKCKALNYERKKNWLATNCAVAGQAKAKPIQAVKLNFPFESFSFDFWHGIACQKLYHHTERATAGTVTTTPSHNWLSKR